MSIEALIQAHTEALLANTEAVKLLTLSLAGRTPAKSEDKPKAEKVSAEAVKQPLKNAEEKKEEKAAEKASTAEAQEAIDKEQDEKADAVPYETLRALVLKIAPTNREGIKAVSAKHGISAPKDLLKDPQDYSTVTDQAKLEAVYADLLALEA